MDNAPPTNPLVAFVEALRAREPTYDWQPTVEAPALPYERRLTPCEPPAARARPESLEAARELIRSSILEYLEMPLPSHLLLVKTLPGTGKTTAAVEIVDQLAAEGRRVAYAGPRHDLYMDILAKTGQMDLWYEWLPRQAEDPDVGKIQTCNYPLQIAEWLQKGYEAMDFCAGVCGWDYVSNRCVYHQQKLRSERAIYIQHQHVTLGHPLEFSVLFGDESPLAAFTNEWRIPARYILPPGMDMTEPLTEVLSMMTAIAQTTTRAVSGPELLELLGGAEDIRQAVEAFEIPTTDLAAAGEIHRAEQVEQKPYFHLFDTCRLLLRETRQALNGADYPHRLILSQGYMNLLLRQDPPTGNLPPHIVWLDGTGRPEIYERIFRRPVQVVDASPRLQGRIFQVVDRANGKRAMLGTDKKKTAKARQADELMKRIIELHGYQRPAIISYKDFETEIDGVQTGHFYAARGTNAFEDADAILIAGAPQPNIYDVVKHAKMIYFERDTAFKVVWSTQERPYSYTDPEDGQGRQYPVSGFWHDPDLQAVLEVMREDEIIQMAHRGRPVNHPVDIWLLTNIPIESLPPDQLVTMREIMDSPEGVSIFKWAQVQELAKAQDEIYLCDLVNLGMSEHTAKKYLERLVEMGWQPGVKKPEDARGGRPKRYVRRGVFRESIKNISFNGIAENPPVLDG
jgi:hypothetical protein